MEELKIKKETLELIKKHPKIIDKYLKKWLINHVELVEAVKLFKADILTYSDIHPKERLDAFFDHYGEPDWNHKKMYCQFKLTWSTGGRLRTWQKNEKKFSSGGFNNSTSESKPSISSPFKKRNIHN
jgi:hypothetical protein